MRTSDNINEIAAALSQLQGTMSSPVKNAKNPHFSSTFADLDSIFISLRDPLLDNGLCVLQVSTSSPDGASITTRVTHASGQWIEFGPLTIPLGKANAHGVGGAITYGKRYAISAALGITASDIDDDGNEAVSSVQLAKYCISDTQKKALEVELRKVPDYRKSIINRLKAEYGSVDLGMLPVALYEAVMDGAIKQRVSKETVGCL